MAISVPEAPLKFRARGITLALGLGIGRLVFRALNLAEVTLVAILTAVCAATLRPGNTGWALLGAAWGLLVVQVVLLRPRLDRRALQIVAGGDLPPSRQHLAYIALEGVKIVVLVALGGALLSGALA